MKPRRWGIVVTYVDKGLRTVRWFKLTAKPEFRSYDAAAWYLVEKRLDRYNRRMPRTYTIREIFDDDNP